MKFHLASVFGLVSGRPVFKTWAVGLNLCPSRSSVVRNAWKTVSDVTTVAGLRLLAPFSSGSQLAAFELKNWHVLIIIHDKSHAHLSMFKAYGCLQATVLLP
ncbi:hypothetical protein EFM55_01180 [Lactiplantibacillus pentosus]|nr:hypothetical protein [Lactiplantibacillus pentosus]